MTDRVLPIALGLLCVLCVSVVSGSRLRDFLMPRIVSLIASATEIVAALGFERDLVGRSHECDFPASIQALPILTAPKFDIHGSSLEIDQRVKTVLRESASVYRVDADRLK